MNKELKFRISVAHKVATSDAGIPCGCRFESGLFHIVHSSQMIAQVLGALHPHEKPTRSSRLLPGVCLAHPWILLVSIWGANQWVEDLPLCNSATEINLQERKRKEEEEGGEGGEETASKSLNIVLLVLSVLVNWHMSDHCASFTVPQ